MLCLAQSSSEGCSPKIDADELHNEEGELVWWVHAFGHNYHSGPIDIETKLWMSRVGELIQLRDPRVWQSYPLRLHQHRLIIALASGKGGIGSDSSLLLENGAARASDDML